MLGFSGIKEEIERPEESSLEKNNRWTF